MGFIGVYSNKGHPLTECGVFSFECLVFVRAFNEQGDHLASSSHFNINSVLLYALYYYTFESSDFIWTHHQSFIKFDLTLSHSATHDKANVFNVISRVNDELSLN